MLEDYTDEKGFKHRSYVPKDATNWRPQDGLPIELDFEQVAEDFGMPLHFAVQLQAALWEQDIITPEDYLKDDIHAKVGAALRRCLKVEANELVTYVRRLKDGSNH